MKLAPDNLRFLTLQLFSKLTIVPNFLISTNSYLQAFNLCKDLGEKDTAYLALSIEFDIELVTKDEELATHLRQKGFQKILTLKEFLEGME
jgi:predicted nucleic acid-binding protein